MKNRQIFFSISLALILLIVSFTTETFSKEGSLKIPKNSLLSMTLKWTMKDNSMGQIRVVDSLKLSNMETDSFYLLFRKNARLEALFCYDNKTIPLGIDLDKTSSLVLSVTWGQGEGVLTLERLLFAADRVVGIRVPMQKNMYCLTVVKDIITRNKKNIPNGVPEQFHALASRTLAMNMLYAAESDKYAGKIGKTFEVKTEYAMPRFILSSEEWIKVPIIKKKKKSSGGFFGAGLEAKITGEPESKTKNIPVYSLDVMQDRMETKGEFPIAFQTARSIYNDTLESRVIYQLTEGKRRILSASVVFGQMMKNRKLRGMENETIIVASNNLSVLNTCSSLWPAAKTQILSFVKSHPDWKIIIPRHPVVFFHGDDPLYGMYAWFQVEPKTGRIKGILPTGLHGATEENSLVQEILRKEAVRRTKGAVKKIVKSEGGIHAFFGTVAGMYVSSGGILEGVTITMVNPNIASLSGEEWEKFLASHAIKFSRNFLTANKDLYDSYSVRTGFWAGVAAITSHFNGKDAASQCLENAWQDIEKKVTDDIKSWGAKQVHKEAGEAGLDIIEEAYKRYYPKEKRSGRLFNKVENQYGAGQASFGKDSEIKSHIKKAIGD